jgi:hypothetical protein
MKFKESPTFSKHFNITKRSYENLIITTVQKCLCHIENSFGIQINKDIPNELYTQPLYEHTLLKCVPQNIYELYGFKRCIAFFIRSHTQTLEMYRDYLEFGNTEVDS